MSYLPLHGGLPSALALGDHFCTEADLIRDTHELLKRLPPDVDCVVGCARSGLIPATLISQHRHLPLYGYSRDRGVVNLGSGHRGQFGDSRFCRHVVVVDDTACLGRELALARPSVQSAFPAARVSTAAIYDSGRSGGVDFVAVVHPSDHLLEWNFANSGYSEITGFDFDGVLCRDCTPDEDDDGPRYSHFLAHAEPLYLARGYTLPLIATARHEKYRDATQHWLDRWGVRCAKLVMRDFEIADRRRWHFDVAAFKAAAAAAAGVKFFAESDPAQAALIAELSRLPVLCPAAGRVYRSPA